MSCKKLFCNSIKARSIRACNLQVVGDVEVGKSLQVAGDVQLGGALTNPQNQPVELMKVSHGSTSLPLGFGDTLNFVSNTLDINIKPGSVTVQLEVDRVGPTGDTGATGATGSMGDTGDTGSSGGVTDLSDTPGMTNLVLIPSNDIGTGTTVEIKEATDSVAGLFTTNLKSNLTASDEGKSGYRITPKQGPLTAGGFAQIPLASEVQSGIIERTNYWIILRGSFDAIVGGGGSETARRVEWTGPNTPSGSWSVETSGDWRVSPGLSAFYKIEAAIDFVGTYPGVTALGGANTVFSLEIRNGADVQQFLTKTTAAYVPNPFIPLTAFEPSVSFSVSGIMLLTPGATNGFSIVVKRLADSNGNTGVGAPSVTCMVTLL